MTRVTLSEVKTAVRDVASRRPTLRPIPLPTPFPTAFSAIRRYHRDGAAMARDYMIRTYTTSRYWGASGPLQARGWARAMIECFDTYARLASGDTRVVMDNGISCDVPFGPHDVGVNVDVILIDPAGYSARLLLWDKPVPTPAEAELLAAPVAAAVEQELGAGRLVAVEVWHLRTGTMTTVSRGDALARIPDVEAIVGRYLS